jgi:hypothetical protein
MKKIHLNRRETVALAVIVGVSILFFAPIGVSAISPKCGRTSVPIDDGRGQIILIDASVSPQKEMKKAVFDQLQDLFICYSGC